ncbi:MAG: serine/threonine protein kinase [Myxococcales bacterium]|nr:MAG: serine/threonine protein kinase [Myxococcales bacterium]
MSDDTVPQFGHALPLAPERGADADEPRATSCPTCGAHFSPDGRFCPFDGTALVVTAGWHPSADALIGTVVDGRYELLRVIGEGGMGIVYEARHRALGKRFALKALRKDLAQDAEIAARFIQEARTAAAVSHPGLVEITDFGRLDSGQVYFVMELLEGHSLAALLRTGGPLPAARALEMVRQLAHALKAAHDASIVHRDLKPDNIHIGRGDAGSDVVKVVDFGLAKVIGSSKLTRAGVVFGTPHYMSPEQAAGEVVDHRADIYALGIVMYEMFTGKVPFEADSYMGVLTKHLYMTPEPPSSLCPELKALGALEDVILRCLQKRPEARYDGLALLLADLDERLPHLARPARAPFVHSLLDQVELPSTRSSPSRRAFRWGPALGVALAFVLGLALVVTLRRRPADPGARANVVLATPGPKDESARGAAPTITVSARPSATTSPTPSAAPSAPARKPADRVRAVTPSKRTSASKSPTGAKRGLGSGDIVDPWAR